VRHAVRADLLAAARRDGPDHPLVRAGVGEAVQALLAGGAVVVLCTCSTLGAAAEEVSVPAPATVLRVDRPMAERAVEIGRRVAVVAAVAATLGPTRALVAAVAARAGRTIEVTEILCDEAWPYFERGDVARYLDTVGAAARRAAGRADVVLLAQASMAPVAERLAGSGVPVLSSPRLGVEAAVRAYRARGRGRA
jgi:hypothetical protein